jgi:hypothetical protein
VTKTCETKTGRISYKRNKDSEGQVQEKEGQGPEIGETKTVGNTDRRNKDSE